MPRPHGVGNGSPVAAPKCGSNGLGSTHAAGEDPCGSSLPGCEYSGTTTLAEAIGQWAEATLGGNPGSHDHFKGAPEHNLTAEEEAQYAALQPRLLEMFQRYQIEYHLQPGFFAYPDHVMVGMHLEDAVYAPLYYGYGGPGQYAERTEFARYTEQRILDQAPDVIEILVRATPEVIRQRMHEAPHRIQTIKESDIEVVLEAFENQHAASLIRHKMEIDTSETSVDDCVAQFVAFLRTADDRRRSRAGLGDARSTRR